MCVAPFGTQFFSLRICHHPEMREHLNISYSPLAILSASSQADGKHIVPGNPQVKRERTQIRVCTDTFILHSKVYSSIGKPINEMFQQTVVSRDEILLAFTPGNEAKATL